MPLKLWVGVAQLALNKQRVLMRESLPEVLRADAAIARTRYVCGVGGGVLANNTYWVCQNNCYHNYESQDYYRQLEQDATSSAHSSVQNISNLAGS